MCRAIGEFVDANWIWNRTCTAKDAPFDLHMSGVQKSTFCSYGHAFYALPSGIVFPDWLAESYGPRRHRPSRPQQLWIKAYWKIFLYRKIDKWYVNARRGSPRGYGICGPTSPHSFDNENVFNGIYSSTGRWLLQVDPARVQSRR